MIKIGGIVFEKRATLDETLKALRVYLDKNRIILVDQFDAPYSEEQIVELLNSEYVDFRIKTISELEKETIEESLKYINRVEQKVNEVINSTQPNEVFQLFTEILGAFVQMEKICKYFNSTIINMEEIDDIAKKALAQIEDENEYYIREITEYELLPMVCSFKEFLSRGNVNC